MDIWLANVRRFVNGLKDYPVNCTLGNARWRALMGPLGEEIEGAAEEPQACQSFDAWESLPGLVARFERLRFLTELHESWLKAYLPGFVSRFVERRLLLPLFLREEVGSSSDFSSSSYSPAAAAADRLTELQEQLVHTADAAGSFEDAFGQISGGRRFCVTQRGYLGWVPLEAKEGDEIVAFFGARLLFVVRDAASAHGGTRNSSGGRKEAIRSLVGGAWFYGLMKGETLRMKEVEEIDVVLV
jgi:hypothetical protein